MTRAQGGSDPDARPSLAKEACEGFFVPTISRSNLTERRVSALPEIQTWMWVLFNVGVLVMLALDLGVFHRDAHRVSAKEAAGWSIFWIALALVFNVGVYFGSAARRPRSFSPVTSSKSR